MPLQNRVAPDGSLHAVNARGLFTGNRGIIHDPATKALLGRRWTTKSWIVCACEWKDWKRAPFGCNFNSKAGPRAGWSELFFLDEVTALAAGHRPCFTCRRQAATAFAAACAPDIGAKAMDDLLHTQRWFVGKAICQPVSTDELPAMPDGAMIQCAGQFFALRSQRALPWDFSGYGPAARFAALATPLLLVTPQLALKALLAGFAPVWHPSAA